MAGPTSSGFLAIVGTPIGNRQDITLRALSVLRGADLIAAEDTRHTRLLLAYHGINKPLISYHQFNEAQRVPEVLQHLKTGKTIALVSDAGMPTISDPGLRLVRAAIDHGIPVQVVPGVSAVTAAIAVAGVNASSFYFCGFLPYKSAQRQKMLTSLRAHPVPLIFFESPHRILKTLRDMETVFDYRQIIIARELTKKFEEVLRGTAAQLRKILETRPVKGEFTIIVEPIKP